MIRCIINQFFSRPSSGSAPAFPGILPFSLDCLSCRCLPSPSHRTSPCIPSRVHGLSRSWRWTLFLSYTPHLWFHHHFSPWFSFGKQQFLRSEYVWHETSLWVFHRGHFRGIFPWFDSRPHKFLVIFQIMIVRFYPNEWWQYPLKKNGWICPFFYFPPLSPENRWHILEIISFWIAWGTVYRLKSIRYPFPLILVLIINVFHRCFSSEDFLYIFFSIDLQALGSFLKTSCSYLCSLLSNLLSFPDYLPYCPTEVKLWGTVFQAKPPKLQKNISWQFLC